MAQQQNPSIAALSPYWPTHEMDSCVILLHHVDHEMSSASIAVLCESRVSSFS
jgi:hypothetical protein